MEVTKFTGRANINLKFKTALYYGNKYAILSSIA